MLVIKGIQQDNHHFGGPLRRRHTHLGESRWRTSTPLLSFVILLSDVYKGNGDVCFHSAVNPADVRFQGKANTRLAFVIPPGPRLVFFFFWGGGYPRSFTLETGGPPSRRYFRSQMIFQRRPSAERILQHGGGG